MQNCAQKPPPISSISKLTTTLVSASVNRSLDMIIPFFNQIFPLVVLNHYFGQKPIHEQVYALCYRRTGRLVADRPKKKN